MKLEELLRILAFIPQSATVKFDEYLRHDIGDVVATFGEDGTTTVVFHTAKEKTDQQG